MAHQRYTEKNLMGQRGLGDIGRKGRKGRKGDDYIVELDKALPGENLRDLPGRV